MDDEVSFGRWLQRRRRALDLTQAELARAAACSSVMLRMVEADERRPSKELAARLAEHLAIAPVAREAFVRCARGERLVAALGPAEPPADAAQPPPLPAPLTTLVGRQPDVAAVTDLLQQPGVRLVTLTGPGGVGKTRLALAVAATLRAAHAFAGGVWFVDLSALHDPALVTPTIARALAAPAGGGDQAVERLARAIGDRHLLLVLDNFEQVAAAAPVLARLLAATPRLTALVTSRVVLHLSGEHEWPVPPLALPDTRVTPTATALAAVAAVSLFVERAASVMPSFTLTDDNAAAVAAICAQVDGLPLAIELAASQIKVLPPAALRRRLDNRLGLLVGGPRDQPTRRQALRATLAWSHDLLGVEEQVLFRRLAVFAGGFTVEAAEHVGDGPDLPKPAVLARLMALVDHSMVHAAPTGDDDARFYLLETIREFGREHLAASGELAAVQARHAQAFLALAETAEPALHGPEQRRWLARLEADHDNLRAVLAWSLDGDAARAPLGVRLAGALARFWHVHGHHDEGRRWLERALAVGSPAEPRGYARVLLGLGILRLPGGDTARAVAPLTNALALFQATADALGVAMTLQELGVAARLRGEYDTATRLLTDALAHFRDLDDRHGMAWASHELAIATRNLGDYAAATRQLEEALTLFRALGHERGIAWALRELGVTARNRADLDRSATLLAASLPLMRGIGDTWGTARVLQDLAITARFQGDYARAATLLAEAQPTLERLGDRPSTARYYLELGVIAAAGADYHRATALLATSLSLLREARDQRGMPGVLDELARLAVALGQPGQAATLLGAAMTLRAQMGAPVVPVEQPARDATEATVRATLGEVAFATWTTGPNALTTDSTPPLLTAAGALLAVRSGRAGPRRRRGDTAGAPLPDRSVLSPPGSAPASTRRPHRS